MNKLSKFKHSDLNIHGFSNHIVSLMLVLIATFIGITRANKQDYGKKEDHLINMTKLSGNIVEDLKLIEFILAKHNINADIQINTKTLNNGISIMNIFKKRLMLSMKTLEGINIIISVAETNSIWLKLSR
jgi:hypothetical protein